MEVKKSKQYISKTKKTKEVSGPINLPVSAYVVTDPETKETEAQSKGKFITTFEITWLRPIHLLNMCI